MGTQVIQEGLPCTVLTTSQSQKACADEATILPPQITQVIQIQLTADLVQTFENGKARVHGSNRRVNYYPLAHLSHVSRSLSILMKTPPITDRALKPRRSDVCVQYQSVSGTRCGVLLTNA